MPLYEFIGPDGQCIERRTHHAETVVVMNGRRFERSPVTQFAIAGREALPTQGEEMLRGYHREEIKKGSRFFSRYSKDTIKRVWKA